MISIKQLIPQYFKEIKNINSVIDLGCGKSKKSSYFFKQGIKVIGVDKKPSQIKNPNFKFVHKNIKDFEFNKKYDLIMANFILHFFKKQEAINIIKKIQENTNHKGYNFLICMSNQDECMKEHEDNFYPTINELKSFYPENKWKIIKSIQDFTDYEEHGNMLKHRHNIIIILFKKFK